MKTRTFDLLGWTACMIVGLWVIAALPVLAQTDTSTAALGNASAVADTLRALDMAVRSSNFDKLSGEPVASSSLANAVTAPGGRHQGSYFFRAP